MNQHTIIEFIRDWAAGDPEVRSAFLLGSQARGGANGLSDIDVVIETTTEPMAVCLQLQRLLPVAHHQPWTDGKLVLWVGPTQIKVDCWVLADASQSAKYYWGSKPSEFDDWVLFDREGDLEKRLSDTNPAPTNYNDIDWLNLRFVNQLKLHQAPCSQ